MGLLAASFDVVGVSGLEKGVSRTDWLTFIPRLCLDLLNLWLAIGLATWNIISYCEEAAEGALIGKNHKF